eukprot:TRINITY_DN940_c0_g1_i1.p1 TRINITY_DN940_c0_g1~~TRINITY_DN940_c0_g1_i1.p1  ORF type:complete len:336 (+),score=98.90 TRINITY_DN940_c0_g1_i1:128-1135(+)
MILQRIRDDAKYICENSTHVQIMSEGIEKLIELIVDAQKCGRIGRQTWHNHPLHPKGIHEGICDYIFVLDCLNFSFWNDDFSPFQVFYEGKVYKGYDALVACLNRAIAENIPITNASFYSTITPAMLRIVLRPFLKDSIPPEIPLLAERVDCLNKCGQILIDKYNGSFSNVLKAANGSAEALVQIIFEDFAPFQDVTTYKGRQVHFLKRAQILVADIWAAFCGEGIGKFNDIEKITMFADYRVPQGMYSLGILQYSNELLNDIHDQTLLPYGCEKEVEIRGASIQAVEDIRKALKDKGLEDFNSVEIDFFLWDFAKTGSDVQLKDQTHRTRSIFY